MKQQKGQALVEFILILPILLLFLLGIFDVGNYLYKRYELASDLDLIIDFYQENKTEEMNQYLKKRGLALTTEVTNHFRTFTLQKTIQIRTPGLDRVLSQELKVETTIYEK